MRTTLTLDDDVAAKVKAEVRKSGRSFEEVVNGLLRLGLRKNNESIAVQPFVVHTRPLGRRPGLNYDKISELVEHVEGSDYR